MKAIFNWRYYVIFALLTIGLLSFLAIGAKDNLPLEMWIKLRVYLAITAFVSFFTLNRLRIYWEKKGEIPEFTNQ